MFSFQNCKVMQNKQVWGRTTFAITIIGCFASLRPSCCIYATCSLHGMGGTDLYVVLLHAVVVINEILKYDLLTRSPVVTRKQRWNWNGRVMNVCDHMWQ